MTSMALNQMTMPTSSACAVLDMAQALNCDGVELRNDLGTGLFDGHSAGVIRDAATARGLRIFALAEVYGFNDTTAQITQEVTQLVAHARASGALAIVLIPRIEQAPVPRARQRQMLRDALVVLQPILEGSGITALIEPLGFANSSLRLKADAVAVLDALGRPDCFALVHDTFHHAVAGERDVFAALTRVVHISGVSDPQIGFDQMRDTDRGLIDARDRLDSTGQINALRRDGYDGPLSFEVFAPDIHTLDDPTDALLASTHFIQSQIA